MDVLFRENTESRNGTSGVYDMAENVSSQNTTSDPLNITGKVFIALATAVVILGAIIGNSLVVAAVYKFHRLRCLTNYFIVSLALADLLVAVLVMPFNASLVVMDRWVFDSANSTIVCDIFNSNDVLFSTASLLHLCCISVDRFIAIIHPLHYDSKMTKARVGVMLTVTWLVSFLISYIPIHTHIYTPNHLYQKMFMDRNSCAFEVTRPFAAVSSSVSFWIPAFIMVIVYLRIFNEARKQEKSIHAAGIRLQRTSLESNSDNSVILSGNPTDANGNGVEHGQSPDTSAHSGVSQTQTTNGYNASPNAVQFQTAVEYKNNNQNHQLLGGQFKTHLHARHAEHSSRKKMKREHKAAKTLGIIMGAFLMCWLPFFLWYTITNVICDPETCKAPDVVVSLLFWIGYINSSLNPLIYAYFNREFRNAFKKLLRLKKCFKDGRGTPFNSSASTTAAHATQVALLTKSSGANSRPSTSGLHVPMIKASYEH